MRGIAETSGAWSDLPCPDAASGQCLARLKNETDKALSGTHLYPCNYYSMRGIAETSGAWSDMLALMDVLH